MTKKKRPRGVGIACPACGSIMSRVSRTTARAGIITRRRQCSDCSYSLTTDERPRSAAEKGALVRLERISIADLLRQAGFTDCVPPSSVNIS